MSIRLRSNPVHRPYLNVTQASQTALFQATFVVNTGFVASILHVQHPQLANWRAQFTPLTAAAVVPLYDAQGNPAGYGPAADPKGVFYGVTGMAADSVWTVTSHPSLLVEIRPREGGRFTYTGAIAGQSYTFSWSRWSAAIPGTLYVGSKTFVA